MPSSVDHNPLNEGGLDKNDEEEQFLLQTSTEARLAPGSLVHVHPNMRKDRKSPQTRFDCDKMSTFFQVTKFTI